MIPASALHRLLENLVESSEIQGNFDDLVGFVGTYGLDLQDSSTLFRVASGETYEHQISNDAPPMEAKR